MRDFSCSSMKQDDPCFADNTMACRLTDVAAVPSTAFEQCFGDDVPTLAERVPMKDLMAGDVVLASPTQVTRVIVNQHAAVYKTSSMVTIQHEHGSLAVTPDHVIYADGIFKPAAQVGIGAVLEPPSKVTKVTKALHGIVNPLTTSGTILAAGPTGAPVVALIAGDWIADLILESTVYPLPISVSAAASYFFPAGVQAYYDAMLEPYFTTTAPGLKNLKASVPVPVALAILFVFDVSLVAGFTLWAACGLKGLTAFLAIVAAAKLRPKA